jgi:hypothetical protein
MVFLYNLMVNEFIFSLLISVIFSTFRKYRTLQINFETKLTPRLSCLGKYLFVSSFLIMIILVSNLSNNVLSVNAMKSHIKNQSVSDVNHNLPAVKLVYKGTIYDMLPFIVVKENELKRLNFPEDADGGEVPVDQLRKISSYDNISFSFATKPREINAFAIDYDSDVTEMTPLNRIGENEFGLGDIYGIKTLELRVIYPDGMYATYTLLFNIEKADKIHDQEISTHIMQMHNNDSYGNLKSYDPDSSDFGQVSPTEEQVLNQFDKSVNLGNVENQGEHPSPDYQTNDLKSKKSCEYNDIPIADVQTNRNTNNSDIYSDNSTHKQKWTALDLGQKQNICAIKVTFANEDDEIKFFKVEFSNDGKQYTPAEYYSTSGTNSPSEIYDLNGGPVNARFVKITELDITDSTNWISDLTVLGNTEL